MGLFTRPAEEAEQLDGLIAGCTEPVRYPGVELGDLAGLHREIVAAEQQPQLAAEYVQPFVPVVRLELWPLALGPDHLEMPVAFDSSISVIPRSAPTTVPSGAPPLWSRAAVFALTSGVTVARAART